MKKELMSIIVCPMCKKKLELKITEEAGGEVLNGSLHCPNCDTNYSIVDTIPNLLPLEVKHRSE